MCDTLAVVVALAIHGEAERYARLRREWIARFALGAQPAPDDVELELLAACLRTIEHRCQQRAPALRCLASLVAARGHDVTAGALWRWADPVG